MQSSSLLEVPELRGYSQDELQALEVLSDYFGKSIEETAKIQQQENTYNRNDVVEWGEHNFYIPETEYYIQFFQHQKAILRCMFQHPIFSRAQTFIYSAPKKSGKTAIAALVGKWIAETWGRYAEVYCVANDEEQAIGRLFEAIRKSIDLDPRSIRKGSVLQIPGEWEVVKRLAKFLPSGGTIQALSGDYKGQAGSNPTCSLWTELWGYTSEDSKRLWSEMTPSPTRKKSIRFIETYAGYEGESELLWDLWQEAVKFGRQLTRDDVPDWPFDGPIPLYYNEAAHLFAYIDHGVEGRRMPWQTPEYYEAESHDLTPEQMLRLHMNEWVTSQQEFIPFEWWDRQRVKLPELPPNWPICMSADAAVSSDCCAVGSACRRPDNQDQVMIPFYAIWYPPEGGKFDYGETLEPEIRYRCAPEKSGLNIVQCSYDEYQLHDLMTRLRKEAITWIYQFSQASPRSFADKQLFDMIRDRKLWHNVGNDADEHIKNSDRKQSITEDTKLRIVKRRETGKIDFTIAESMAVYECMRLNIEV